MPAIYTFSLDYVRDQDLIELLESKKNRSDYIRTILRKDDLSKLYMNLFDDVYIMYRAAMVAHAKREPVSKESIIAKKLIIKQEEE